MYSVVFSTIFFCSKCDRNRLAEKIVRTFRDAYILSSTYFSLFLRKLKSKPLLFPNWVLSIWIATVFRSSLYLIYEAFGQNNIHTDSVWYTYKPRFTQNHIIFFPNETKKDFKNIFFSYLVQQTKYAEVYFEQQEFIVKMNLVDIFGVPSTTTAAAQALGIYSKSYMYSLILSYYAFFLQQIEKKEDKNEIFPAKIHNKNHKRKEREKQWFFKCAHSQLFLSHSNNFK